MAVHALAIREVGKRVSNGRFVSLVVVTPILCTLLVTLRFYARKLRNTPLGIDDWLCIPTLFLFLAIAIISLYGAVVRDIAYQGDPLAAIEVRKKQIANAFRIYSTVSLVQIPALSFTKLSCMFYYRRIFNTGSGTGASKVCNWSINFVIALLIVWTVTFFALVLFACDTNFYALWNGLMEQKRCPKFGPVTVAFGITDVFTDLIVLFFPLPWLWRLQMTWKRKLGYALVFLLGGLAPGASASRLILVIKILKASNAQINPLNPIAAATVASFLLNLELAAAIMAACLPSVSCLFVPANMKTIVGNYLSCYKRTDNDDDNNASQIELGGTGSQAPVEHPRRPRERRMDATGGQSMEEIIAGAELPGSQASSSWSDNGSLTFEDMIRRGPSKSPRGL